MSKPKKKNGVTQAQLTRHWGLKSRSYVQRLVDDGMPLTSIEDAENWRNERNQRIGSRTKKDDDSESRPNAAALPPEDDRTKSDGAGESSPPAEPEEPEEVEHEELLGLDMTGLERELKNARAMARSAARRVRLAEKTKGMDALVGQRQQTYNKAVENYERMEKSVRRERMAREELMTVDQHKVQLNRLWVPAITLMRKLPRTLAIKVNPGDDVFAEKILAQGVEEVITEMRRSLKEPVDPAWHLTVFLAYVLQESGPAKVLELLDEARGKVEKAITEGANEPANA